jgi:hypothetical protein
MSNRTKIIKQLQERFSEIDKEIDKLLQDRYLHTRNIKELSKKTYNDKNNDSDSGEESEVSGSDLSIEIIIPEEKVSSSKKEKKGIKTREQKRQEDCDKQTKAQERQEERDKARAWA